MKITLPSTVEEYHELACYIESLRSESESEWAHWLRSYSQGSLYFLLSYVLLTRFAKTPSGEHLTRNQWWLDRCNDVQFERNNVLDIWAREHGKSTVKTYADNIRLALINPNIAICIFSITDKMAQAHITRIRVELEQNDLLQHIFSDRLWGNPKREAPSWSNDKGLCIRRQANRFEQTFECSGFQFSVPVGKHYDVLDFDDCVTRESATSIELNERSREGFSEASNLSTRGAMFSYTGTYYTDSDLWRYMEDEAIVDRTRLYPAWDTRQPRPDLNDIGGGEPVLLTAEELREKKKRMGPAWYSVQMGLDPRGGESQLLEVDLIHRYRKNPFKASQGGNVYLLCDGGGGKTDTSGTDPTAFMAVALQGDQNYYVVDLVEKPMSPTERIKFAMSFHRRWSEWARVQEFRWEETGTGSDVHHLERMQAQQNYRFRITRIPRGGAMRRDGQRMARNEYYYNSIEPMLPRLFVPVYLKGEVSGREVNIADHFINGELGRFPLAKMDHLVSCLVLLLEEPASTRTKKIPPLIWPQPSRGRRRLDQDDWDDDEEGSSTWMAA